MNSLLMLIHDDNHCIVQLTSSKSVFLPMTLSLSYTCSSPQFLSSLTIYPLPFSPQERGKKIIELARKYNLLVVCDDIYNFLYFPEKGLPLKRLFAHDDK